MTATNGRTAALQLVEGWSRGPSGVIPSWRLPVRWRCQRLASCAGMGQGLQKQPVCVLQPIVHLHVAVGADD
jgi:hypothetical protein